MDSSGQISVRLSRAEALVLFEFLARCDGQDLLPVEHPSEERVLGDIQCVLEKVLAEPLASNYKELLDQARREVCP